jgi:hypothetical protein
MSGTDAVGRAPDSDLEEPLLTYEEAAGHNKECESALLAVIDAVSQVTEMLELSQKEVYCGMFLGRMWFMPGLGLFRHRHLPYRETQVIPQASKCARLAGANM